MGVFQGVRNRCLGPGRWILPGFLAYKDFQIYQLDFGDERKAIPFAFLGIEALHKAPICRYADFRSA
ncbi:hypothetical protein [Enterocloster bolteae]|uniref:hypothetical protein n=1 Tax=Enterocloster bolteae TaxID=208479 RepID=UPI00046520F5|nr:hypothetical protein [Enterocloster bolteae]RGB92587.1 hypothetical protein DWZ21_27315 [Hungatella hathewayi]UOX70361.1 hypothetical protein K4205_01530 [Enterocloster bolteae]